MPIKIYIDQGHNPFGANVGAEGNGYFEQDISFDIGTRLAARLRANCNFSVRVSRPNKDTVLGTSNATSLRARVDEANSWGADAFLSIHTNASVDPNANGSECLVYSTSTAKAATALAGNILKKMTEATGLRSRGVISRPELYVLKRTRMPAVIVEMGFITNPKDANLMVSYPELFALGIERGILTYYGLPLT